MSVVIVIRCVFFFNDRATTEISTYVHTLSLPDALPISPKREPEIVPVEVPDLGIVYDDDDIVVVDKPSGVAAHPSMGWEGPTVLGALAAAGRSEEHTSELQSLMRISYAVFCLKKKKIIINT